MSTLDDDDVLAQLCAAWVLIAEGGDKATEATFLLQELLDKFGVSVRVLNSLAACHMSLRNYSQAFQYCKQAREAALQAGGKPAAETLVNTIICLTNMRKDPAVIAKVARRRLFFMCVSVSSPSLYLSVECTPPRIQVCLLKRTTTHPQITAELRSAAPNCAWLKQQESMGLAFDRIAAEMAN